MLKNVNRIFLSLILTCILLGALTGCGGRDPLVGKWEEPTSGVTMEIDNKGEVIIELHGAYVKMTYEVQDPDKLIFKATTDGSIPDQQMTYRIEEDKLILTVDGIDTIFLRKK